MKTKFEEWCYGGKSKAFFIKQNEEIHQYNSKILERLLLVITLIMGIYLVISTGAGNFSKYSDVYFYCFIILFFLLLTYRFIGKKSIIWTRIYIVLFSLVMFIFISVLGTVYEPNTRATLIIVYTLALPMLFIIPTNYMYGFLGIAIGTFSIVAFQVKGEVYAQMDVAHAVTCLVIGLFLSRQILKSRMSLYAINEQIDTRNIQLENLTQNLPGGVCQCKNNEELTFISMSDGFLTMFGYSQQEINDLFHNSFLNMILEEDRELVMERVVKGLASGDNIEVEHRVQCKTGEPVWILGKGRLLPDGNGNTFIYGMVIEITERKKQQEELRLRLEQHQIIMDQTTDIIFEWDIRKDTLTFSTNWSKKFGYDPIGEEISGRIPLSANIHQEDMSSFVKIMKETAGGKPYSEAEFRIKNVKGRYRWCRIRATAQFDHKGNAIKAVGVILDINSEKKEKQNLLKLAQRDPLTGIYNKAATNALVARRMDDFDFTVLQALLIIDVDYFKAVNDTYGHLIGDNILSAVATQLKQQVRSSDVVGRIGGDEFLVYLPQVENEESALWKAESLHAALGVITPEQGAAPITCSIGMAVFHHGEVEYSELYQYADVALYKCKKEGRNGVGVYDHVKDAQRMTFKELDKDMLD